MPGPLPSDPRPPLSRPPGWPALAVYALAFLLILLSSTIVPFAVALVRTGGQRSELQAVAYEYAVSAPGLIVGAGVNAALLSVVAFVAARLSGRHVPTTSLRLGATRTSVLGGAAAILGLIGLSLAGDAISELLRVRGGTTMDLLGEALRAPPAARFVAAFLAIGVAPGFAEETFFRGYLQTRLAASWGRWPAIVVSAGAFGLLHFDLVQGSVAFLGGLYLGAVADRLGGIRPSILAHVTNNALFVTVAAFGDVEAPSRSWHIGAFFAGVVLWVAAVAALRSRRAVAA